MVEEKDRLKEVIGKKKGNNEEIRRDIGENNEIVREGLIKRKRYKRMNEEELEVKRNKEVGRGRVGEKGKGEWEKLRED